jgi:superfamily I DNA and/or RNA helicase
MENFGELITQILPCTLMSPDSVARFFPAKQGIFDIVVFDEASQIRVADAVGAMGRSKSVVVVGDSKQMPPTSFAEASASLDEEDDYNPEIVLDEESILTECVQARVPRQWLSWHFGCHRTRHFASSRERRVRPCWSREIIAYQPR